MPQVEFARKIIGVPLQKATTKRAEDGSLFVNGFFTSDNKDELGDVITRDATERALPKYKKWGNIRYMHLPKPVGKVVRIGESDGLDWNEVEIKVIDPQAVFEVEQGLLTALSVGILIDWEDITFEDDGGWIIHDYQLTEISLVDHPANYDARLRELPVDQSLRLLIQNHGFGEVAKSFQDMLDKAVPVGQKTKEELMGKEEFISLRLAELIDENPELSNEAALAAAEAEADEKDLLDEIEESVDAEPVQDNVDDAGGADVEPELEELSLAGAINEFSAVVRQISDVLGELRAFLETQAEVPQAEGQSEGDDDADRGLSDDDDELSSKKPANRSGGVPATDASLDVGKQAAEQADSLRLALTRYFENR